MADSLTRALIAHFDGVFEGPNGNFSAILESIAELSAKQSAWKPAPQSNSIWQLVDHLTASKEWQIQMLETGQAASIVWTEPVEDEAAWQASISRLKEAHAHLKLTLSKLSPEELLEKPVPEWSQTLLELVLAAGSAHDAHHCGQIDYLRGLLITNSIGSG